MQAPLETAELLAFARTVDAKSLTRAASELGVPRATLSRRLARLEQRIGARLLRRTTRSLVLTDAGEILYRHARIVLDAVSVAEASVRHADNAVRGELRVSVLPFTSAAFLDAIAGFAEAHPEVRLHVQFTTRVVDLRRDAYDVAIRASSQLEPGLIARTLLRVSLVAVASPAYLAAHGAPRTPRDLRHHRCLMGFARGEQPQTHWTFSGRKIAIRGAVFSSDPRLLCRLAARGQGIAVVPLLVARDDIERGDLVTVLPGSLGSDGRLAIVYAERELLPPQVRAFVDWVAARLPAALEHRAPPARRSRKRK